MTEDRGQRTEKPVIGLPGFSLIELLVVISIIAAALAILMPGLGKARSVARRTGCASNLRQIDVAISSYLNSNDDKYPAAQDPLYPNIWLWMGRGWRGFISPHLGGNIDANNPSVLLCPADRTEPNRFEQTSYSYSMALYHSPEQIDDMNSIQHAYNPALVKPSIGQKCVNVANPAGKIIIGEWYSNHRPIMQGNDPGWWGLTGQRNFLFADGQVKFLKAVDIRTANDGNPNPNLTKNGIKGTDWPK
ncbi:MAG: DUF1559 domain-containing protein [Sedimentisphaerales bacterium]|nr:DUF1559 domain-containing protein [Sedimentisphaerales bacterium]